MLEALAASTVMATKWDRQSPFINPMCGSGTVAIEAALLATNRRPGLYRTNYSFMHLKDYDEQVYLAEMQRLRDQIKEVPGLHVEATDISDDAINVSKVNAGIAGVENLSEVIVKGMQEKKALDIVIMDLRKVKNAV